MKNLLIIALSFIYINTYAQILPTEDPIIRDVGSSNASTVKIIENSSETNPILQYPVLVSLPKEKGTNKRRVYFIHGLGGNGASWTDAADAFHDQGLNVPGFQARECKTTRLDYNLSTSGDLRAAAYQIRNDIAIQANTDINDYDMNPDPSYAFLIGHSQGGVVGRALLDLDFFYDPPSLSSDIKYGGLVTVSSPLQGARILNNRNDILQMANVACNKLKAGPATAIAPHIPVIRSIIRSLAQDFGSTFCDLTSYNVLPVFFKNDMTPITEHYKVGAGQLTDFNTSATGNNANNGYNQLHKIAFYGYEPKENLFWRTLNWIVNDPNGLVPGSSSTNLPNWGANDDYYFLNNSIIPTRNAYFTKRTICQNNIDNYWIDIGYLKWLFFNPAAIATIIYDLIQIGYNEEERDDWDQGVDWFDYTANPTWSSIIGARSYTSVEKYICFCRDDLDGPYEGMIVDDISDCTDHGCVARPYTEYSLTLKPSDGVVLNESAMNMPGATHAPVEVKGYEISPGVWSGSSHMQIRNDEGLKTHMNKLLEGNYDSFFQTDPQ